MDIIIEKETFYKIKKKIEDVRSTVGSYVRHAEGIDEGMYLALERMLGWTILTMEVIERANGLRD